MRKEKYVLRSEFFLFFFCPHVLEVTFDSKESLTNLFARFSLKSMFWIKYVSSNWQCLRKWCRDFHNGRRWEVIGYVGYYLFLYLSPIIKRSLIYLLWHMALVGMRIMKLYHMGVNVSLLQTVPE